MLQNQPHPAMRMRRHRHSRHPAVYVLSGILFFFFSVCSLVLQPPATVQAASSNPPPFILLSHYHASIPIDGQFTLIAVCSNGAFPRFSSSKSSIASVNTYGVVTGRKSGTCTITAKVRGAEASCKVTVEKSIVTIDKTSVSIENGVSIPLTATVSTGHDVVWKSSASSIAAVDEDGIVTAKKCGNAIIRATADGVTAKCRVTVRKPTLSLSHSRITLYPDDTFSLTVRCSSNRPISFRSSSSATASVDENGQIYAHKKGTATITVKVDGVSRTCKVTVKPLETSAALASHSL